MKSTQIQLTGGLLYLLNAPEQWIFGLNKIQNCHVTILFLVVDLVIKARRNTCGDVW